LIKEQLSQFKAIEKKKKKQLKEEEKLNSSSLVNKSIMNYTIDEFISMQKEDLEKIGISGELFKDVWQEYKRQGKTME